jgi:hypothetical protein
VLTAEEKSSEASFLNQRKSRPIYLQGTNLLNSVERWIDLLLIPNFGSIENMLKLLLCTEKGKKGVTLFLKELDVPLPEDQLNEVFNKGISRTLSILQQHLRNVSVSLAVLPGITKDLYEAIRNLISYCGSHLLNFGGPKHKMGTLYSGRHVANLQKKDEIRVVVKSLFFREAMKAAEEEFDRYKRLYTTVNFQHFPLSYNRTQLCAFQEPWQVFSLKMVQVFKMEGFVEGLTGLHFHQIFEGQDGSVLKDVGSNVQALFLSIKYNPNIFKPHVKRFLATPHPVNLLFGNETKVNTNRQLLQVGAQICDLEHYTLQVSPTLSFRAQLQVHTGDGSNIWKVLQVCGGTSNHKCPFGSCCFSPENREKLLSQKELNKIPRLNLPTIEQGQMNDHRRKVAVSNSNHAAYPLPDKLGEVLVDEVEKSQPNENAKGVSFACHGSGIIGCSRVTIFDDDKETELTAKQVLKRWVVNSGAKFLEGKSKWSATFIICSYNSALKLLKDPRAKNCILVPLRFLAAVSFGHVKIDQFHLYNFTSQTQPPKLDTCTCAWNVLAADPNTTSSLVLGYWNKLNEFFPNNEGEVKRLFSSFLERVKIFMDVLHANKALHLTIWNELISSKILNLEKLKVSPAIADNKSRTPNQCPGSRIRNVACGWKDTIIPHLIHGSLTEEKKGILEKLLDCSAVLQFCCYATLEIIQIKEWRVQSWIYAFLERILLKQFFGDKVGNVINLHTHGMTGHLPEQIECAATIGVSLVDVSMERIESQFPKLNKITNNKHQKDYSFSILTKSGIHAAHGDIHRPHNSKNSWGHIAKWLKEYKWVPQCFFYDEDVQALLDKLTEYGYEEGVHWNFASLEDHRRIVRFKEPPVAILAPELTEK